MLVHVLFIPSAMLQTAMQLGTIFLHVLVAGTIWFQKNPLAMTPLGYEFKLALILLLHLVSH